MKKIITIALFVSAFAFVGCSGEGSVSGPRLDTDSEQIDLDDIDINDLNDLLRSL